MEVSHPSMFSSVFKMPKLGRKERRPDSPTMTAGQWNCSKSTCAPTFQLHSYLNLTIGVLFMHTIKFWVRPVDGLITKTFDDSQLAEFFWWLNYLDTNGFKYEHTNNHR